MRKLLILSALSMMAALLFASAANAQQTGPQFCYDGTLEPDYPNCTFNPNINDPNYQALAPASEDATTPTIAPPGPADGVCEGVGEGDPDCAQALLESVGGQPASEQYDTIEEVSTGTASYTELPDTGGPSPLLPLAGLLVCSGLLGFAALRRRG